MRKPSVRYNTRSGQSLVETLVGIIIMVPILLLLFDIGVLVLANTANDNLAKQAARAGASATDAAQGIGTWQAAETAAKTVVSRFDTSGFIPKTVFAYLYYDTNNYPNSPTMSKFEDTSLGSAPATAQIDPGAGNIAVVVAMQVRAPVPFPGFDTNRVFWARAVEPIVALPPQ